MTIPVPFLRLLAAANLCVLTLTSCGPRGGTDVGNGATVTFDMRGFEEKPAPEDAGKAKPASLQLATGDRIDELWIVVDRFKLRADGKCAAGEEEPTEPVDAKGPFVAEVLSTGIVGALPVATVPEGAYCRFEMSLHALEPEEAPMSAPAELVEATVLMRGERADGTPFVVRSAKGASFKLNAVDEPFTVRDGTPFFLGVELSSLVESLDLDSLDGAEIVVDDTSNEDRLADFEDALKSAVRLFEDQDRDGDLSVEEAAPGATLAEGG